MSTDFKRFRLEDWLEKRQPSLLHKKTKLQPKKPKPEKKPPKRDKQSHNG